MPGWRLCLLVLAMLLPPTAARAGEIRLHLTTHGAIETDIAVAHAIDGAHFCSAAPAPWTAPDVRDTRATPFPFYRLIFGQSGPDADLAGPGPSIGLALSNYFAAARDHSDPINDSIELMIDGRHFVGHAAMRDLGYRFAVSYRDDGYGGGFVARHLHEMRDHEKSVGGATLDVEGTWECPPVAADMPEQVVSVHRLFAGAVPARPDPTPMRLIRSDIPCVDRGCASWEVTNLDTGRVYLARVDFSRLHLAKSLRQFAERGEVALLVGGDVRRSEPPRVIAIALDGVMPAREVPSSKPVLRPEQGGFHFSQLHDLIRRVWGKRAEPERHLAD